MTTPERVRRLWEDLHGVSKNEEAWRIIQDAFDAMRDDLLDKIIALWESR